MFPLETLQIVPVFLATIKLEYDVGFNMEGTLTDENQVM